MAISESSKSTSRDSSDRVADSNEGSSNSSVETSSSSSSSSSTSSTSTSHSTKTVSSTRSGSSKEKNSNSDSSSKSDELPCKNIDVNDVEKPIGKNLYKKYKTHAGFKDTALMSFTFINCCVGSGLLAIAKIFSVSGWVMSAIYMVASVAYCFWSFRILSRAAYHGNFVNIREMSTKSWGKGYGILLDVCLAFANTGFLCSYVTVSADYIRDGIYRLGHVDVLGTNTWVMAFKPIIGFGICFPLSLLKTIDMISVISSFAIIFALVAFIGINVRFFQYLKTGKVSGIEHPRPELPVFPHGKDGWLATIAYFTTFFALFTIHANMTPVQRELSGSPSRRKMVIDKSIIISMVVVIFIYIVIGIEGSLMFNRSCTPEEKANGCIAINGNILLTFENDMAMIIIKLLYAIVVLVSFPCMLYPVRTCICGWFKIDKFNGKKTYPGMTKEERKKLPRSVRNGYGWYVLVGFVVLVLDVVLAIAIPAIDKVLSIISNIFGLVLYEMHEMFMWFKIHKLEEHSIGDLIESKLITESGKDSSKKKGSNYEYLSDTKKDKKNKSTLSKPANPIQRLSLARRTSLGNVDDARKYSLVYDKKNGKKNTEDVEYLKQLEANCGGREWSEETTETEKEDLPGLKKTVSCSEENLEKASNEKKEKVDDSEEKKDSPVAQTDAKRASIIQRRASAVVEGNEGDVELVFPDVSGEKYKKNWRFGVFIFFNCFFVAFNLTATVCDIYGWTR